MLLAGTTAERWAACGATPSGPTTRPLAAQCLRRIGPIFRSKDAVAAGVAWRDLYRLRDEWEILELSRGLFQLAEAAGTGNVDFVAVCARAPQPSDSAISSVRTSLMEPFVGICATLTQASAPG